MFIVFNKQKIYSYLVALSTVVVLFVIAFVITNEPSDALQTSINAEQSNNIIQNNKVETNLNNSIINQINNEEGY